MSGKKDLSYANKGLPSLRLSPSFDRLTVSRGGEGDRFSFVDSAPIVRRSRIQIFDNVDLSKSSNAGGGGRVDIPSSLERGRTRDDQIFGSTAKNVGRNKYGLTAELLKEEEDFMRTPVKSIRSSSSSSSSGSRSNNNNNSSSKNSIFNGVASDGSNLAEYMGALDPDTVAPIDDEKTTNNDEKNESSVGLEDMSSNSRPISAKDIKTTSLKELKSGKKDAFAAKYKVGAEDTTGDELKGKFCEYFGEESRINFVKKTRLSYNQINRYDKESDLPEGASGAIQLYLREVNAKNIIPMSCGVLRKESNPKGVFLAHKGLGDVKILPVINVLDKLPCVETIDLCDNRLTDTSLMPLSIKLRSLKHLTHLDLSFNKIDDSSETIMEFLRSGTCPLRVLLLNGADVDDGESVNLFEAIADNKFIHTLGLSNNMIGNTEMEAQTNPDLRTGGQALREMLAKNKSITKLDISWNCIRLQSAVEVGAALDGNNCLKSLNVSHNSFGDIGTQMLGKALRNNKFIEEVDITSNSVTPKSATVLANGLFYNESMKSLKIDGNILGAVGTQAIVAAIQRSAFSDEPRRLQVSFNNCDCKKLVPGLFNAASPGGLWDLDMSEPYGQMVVEECMFLANFRAGCSIEWMTYNSKPVLLERSVLEDKNNRNNFNLEEFLKNCKNCAIDVINEAFPSASENMRVLLNQFQFMMLADQRLKVLMKVRENWFLKTQKADRNDLQEVLLFEVFFALFVINDIDNSGTMECNEFQNTLASLGKGSIEKEFLKRLMAEHDKDDSGTIDANEFAMIMVNEFCRTDVPKGVLVDKSTRKPFAVPNKGRCQVKMIYECDAPTMFDIGRDEGIDAVIEAIRDAKTSDQKEIIFQQATSSPYYFLSSDQGQMLYDEVINMPSMSRMDVIAAILPQLVNEEQVCRFLDNNLDDFGKLTLRVRLGQLYNCYIGIGTGHYSVNLKSHEQMQGVKRLSSIAVSESKFLKQLSMDTSQKGNRSNFRNEMMSTSADFKPIEVDGTWFTGAPRAGTLKFDYVSTQRPRQGTRPISNARFEKILEILDICGIPDGIEALKTEEANKRAERDRPKVLEGADVLTIDMPLEDENDKNQVPLPIDYANMEDFDFEAELMGLINEPSSPASTASSPQRSRANSSSSTASDIQKKQVIRPPATVVEAPDPKTVRRRTTSMDSDDRSQTGSIGDVSISNLSTYAISYSVEAPLTNIFVKDHFFDIMNTCHHYWDIYPKEKLRDVSRGSFDPNKPLVTPPSMDIRPHPDRDEMPCYYPYVLRKLLQLGIMLPGIYFSVEQVCLFLKYFPQECYFRIQLLQTVFSKITDLENFDVIFDKVLTEDERREALHRIGLMNMLDPMKVDRNYCLDLRRMEHREMCKILIALAVAEPGENWVDEEYRWAKYDDCVPGWMLPASWATDDSDNDNDGGPRRFGWITLRYRSEGFGCAPVWDVRKNLRRRFLAGLKRIL